MNRILSILLGLVLMVAVVFQIIGEKASGSAIVRRPLREQIASNVPGWKVADHALADSEEMKKSVGELLNYDDAIFRRYSSGRSEFDVYVAYWRPGKMSQRLVAGHTPDVCWVAAGWTLQSYDVRSLNSDTGGVLPPAQYRVFESAGGKRHVVFWHFSGQEVVSYEPGKSPPWWTPLTDLLRQGFHQRREQFFIRISSEEPMENLLSNAGFREVLRSLPMPGAAAQ